MIKNLQEQIQEMRIQFVNDDISLEELIDKLNKTVYQRGYLSVQIDKAQENIANQNISEFNILTSKFSEQQNFIADKQSYLNKLKPPALFGKAKYQETVDAANREINELKTALENLQCEIDSKRDSYKNAQQLIKRRNEESLISENQYTQDELLFLNEKKSSTENIVKKICSLPKSIRIGNWDTISDYFKDFFRKLPNKNLFPIIGWEYAFEYAVLLSLNYDNWKVSNNAVIINGVSKEFKQVISDFLKEYIKNVESHNSPFHYSVKARVIFIEILHNKDAALLYNMKNTYPENIFAISCNTIINGKNSVFGIKLHELYETLKKAKDLAIEQNDENTLNVIIDDERFYNEVYDFLIEFLK